jgi:hypothetical protein
MTFKDKVGKADATSVGGDKSSVETVLEQVKRTEQALQDFRTMKLALRQGDDLTLKKMNCSDEHIEDLRSRSAESLLQQERRIKNYLRLWQQRLGELSRALSLAAAVV